jgi:hypothetical protein
MNPNFFLISQSHKTNILAVVNKTKSRWQQQWNLKCFLFEFSIRIIIECIIIFEKFAMIFHLENHYVLKRALENDV